MANQQALEDGPENAPALLHARDVLKLATINGAKGFETGSQDRLSDAGQGSGHYSARCRSPQRLPRSTMLRGLL